MAQKHTRIAGKAEGDRDCVVAVFSSRMFNYEKNMQTRPGFLAESLFLLAVATKAKSEVRILPVYPCNKYKLQ